MGIYDRDYYQENELRSMPWDNRSMVTMLIVANVALYVANFLFTSTTNAFTETLVLDSQALRNPTQWWQLLSYGFAHDPSRIGHILFNMATLFFLGRSVEDRLGKWEFLRFYLLTIILCGIVWCAIHGGGPGGLLGASGGTTAVAMLFVFFYPQSTLYLFGAVPVKAWLVGVMIIVGNLFTPMTGDGRVAYDVHLVGAAVAAGYFFGGWNLGFLGSWWGSASGKMKRAKSRLKVHDPDKVESQHSKDELESDRILDKILKEGQDSLTSKEKKFMERYSRQVRERRERL